MSRTRGHARRTKSWGETWSRRASLAGVVGWWLDKMTKRITHRAERRESRRLADADRASVEMAGQPRRKT